MKSTLTRSSNPDRKRIMNSGFTLIEVMIALFILVIIGFATSKAVIDAARLKETLKEDTEFSSEFRTSISLIERDLNQVFNPRWFLGPDMRPCDFSDTRPATPPAKLNCAEVNNRLRGEAARSTEYWGKVFDTTGIRPSRFKGDEKSMSFVSASHLRVYREKRESIYAKVKFEIEKQRENPNLTREQNQQNAGLYSLIKTENTRAFDLDEPKESPDIQYFTVLNQIKSLKFRYYKAGEKNPVNTWDSDTEEFNGAFPEMVEMELSLQALNGRTMDATVMFRLEAPNEILPSTY
jgi:prepilin-type N-terminal cleavage/methylation domain-containing protein